MHTASWIIGVVLGIVFIVLAASNAMTVVSYVCHRRHISAIPIFGGLAGVGACFIIPVPGVRPFWWVPLIVDYGTAPMFITFFVSRIAEFRGQVTQPPK